VPWLPSAFNYSKIILFAQVKFLLLCFFQNTDSELSESVSQIAIPKTPHKVSEFELVDKGERNQHHVGRVAGSNNPGLIWMRRSLPQSLQ
jgi:hypothetical protein